MWASIRFEYDDGSDVTVMAASNATVERLDNGMWKVSLVTPPPSGNGLVSMVTWGNLNTLSDPPHVETTVDADSCTINTFGKPTATAECNVYLCLASFPT